MKNNKQFIIILIGLILISCNSKENKSKNLDLTNDTLENSHLNNNNSAQKMNDTNFTDNIDLLVANATKSGNADDLTKLWSATLKLKQWHFIAKYKEDIQETKTFIGVIDNQPWVLIFTDRQKAQQYCHQKGNEDFTDNKGNVRIISMDTDRAINYILDLQSKGVYGMRINEGNGWFSPIANLKAIIEYVKKAE
jgi:hypothetical protein